MQSQTSRLSEIAVFSVLDQPSNVIEYLCAGFFWVLLGHVEAPLQYKNNRISQLVAFSILLALLS